MLKFTSILVDRRNNTSSPTATIVSIGLEGKDVEGKDVEGKKICACVRQNMVRLLIMFITMRKGNLSLGVFGDGFFFADEWCCFFHLV